MSVQQRGSLMRQDTSDRPKLAALIAAAPAGSSFLVPSVICEPVMDRCASHGRALRVLMSLLWISAETMRRGEQVRFTMSLTEVRVAAGFEKYDKDSPVLEVLELLSEEVCHFVDGGEVPIFDLIGVSPEDERALEWVFNAEFNELFFRPPIYAIADIMEITQLRTGLEIFLYLQVRRIWKMRRSAVELSVTDLIRVAGLPEDVEFRRISERVKRTSERLEALLGGTIELRTLRHPGAARNHAIRLSVVH